MGQAGGSALRLSTGDRGAAGRPPSCRALSSHVDAAGRRGKNTACLSSPRMPSGGPGCPDLQASITLPRRTPGASSLVSASSAKSWDPAPAPVPPASDFSLPGHPKCLPSASSLASCRRQKDLLQWNILQLAVTLRVRPDAYDSRCLPGVWALRDARETRSSAPLRVRRVKNAGSSSSAAAQTPTPGAAPRAPRPQLCLRHRPMAAPGGQAPPSRGICSPGPGLSQVVLEESLGETGPALSHPPPRRRDPSGKPRCQPQRQTLWRRVCPTRPLVSRLNTHTPTKRRQRRPAV